MNARSEPASDNALKLPPTASPAGLAVRALRVYKRFVSPLLPQACRYLPTCSEYGMEAYAVHGFWRGSWLTTRRLCRCHPWGGHGYDPVPPAPAGETRNPDPPSPAP